MEQPEFKPVGYSKEDIGPNLLESITKGLYVNPLHVIREYVMNGIEATPPADEVKVRIEGKDIFIWDNGGGMNEDELDAARKIGFPLKNPKESFGFRGQGIWSGVSVCDTITISTKSQGNEKRVWLKIDAKGLRNELQGRTTKPLTQLLSDHVMMAEMPAPVENHGTLVQLVNIVEEAKVKLLSIENVSNYMQQILPEDFHPSFPYKDQVKELLGRHVPGYRSVKIYLNNEPIRRAPCIDDLESPISDVLRDQNGNPIAFWWACLHKESKAIEQSESAGLVYKKWGVTIGDQKSCLQWWKKSQHLLYWCTGEIHVVDAEVTLDSEKTDFESSPSKDTLLTKCADISRRVNEETRKKSFLEKLGRDLKAAESLCEIPIFETYEEKGDKIREIGNLTRSLRSRKRSKFTEKNMKQPIDAALEKCKKLSTAYLRASTREETRVPHVATVMPQTPSKPVEEIIVRKQQRLPVYSLSELVAEYRLDSTMEQMIDTIERVLDEYFANEPQVRDELKRRIGDELKRALEA